MSQKLINIVIFIGLIGLGALYAMQLGSSSKIGYVKTSDFMAKYKGMNDLEIFNQQAAQASASKLDSLEGAFSNIQLQYAKGEIADSLLVKQILNKMLASRDKLVKEAEEDNNKRSSALLNQVNRTLMEFGKEQGFEIILGTNTSGTLLYASDGIDVTQAAVDFANKNYIGLDNE